MELLIGLGIIAAFIAYGLYKESEKDADQGYCDL